MVTVTEPASSRNAGQIAKTMAISHGGLEILPGSPSHSTEVNLVD
jgi:hypothetical protein